MSSVNLADIFPMHVINTAERTAGLREFKMNRKVRREHERRVAKSHAKEVKDAQDRERRAHKKTPRKPGMRSQRKDSHYARLCDSVFKGIIWLYFVVAMVFGYIMMPFTALMVFFRNNEVMKAARTSISDLVFGKQAVPLPEGTRKNTKSAAKKEAASNRLKR